MLYKGYNKTYDFKKIKRYMPLVVLLKIVSLQCT